MLENQKNMATNKSRFSDAKDNPWELFTAEELASIMHVSKDVIMCCKRNGAHFVFDMSRPEWLHEFLREPRCNGIQLKTILPKTPSVVPRETTG